MRKSNTLYQAMSYTTSSASSRGYDVNIYFTVEFAIYSLASPSLAPRMPFHKPDQLYTALPPAIPYGHATSLHCNNPVL